MAGEPDVERMTRDEAVAGAVTIARECGWEADLVSVTDDSTGRVRIELLGLRRPGGHPSVFLPGIAAEGPTLDAAARSLLIEARRRALIEEGRTR